VKAMREDRRSHWEAIYKAKPPESVSWYQAAPLISLKLLHDTEVPRDAAIVDVGGGASRLVDFLLEDGFSEIAVLDIAEAGLKQAEARLGEERASRVEWIIDDVTTWRPRRRFDVWHDRAVLHFLTDPNDQSAYVETLKSALEPGGWVIIGGFAPGGQTRCSGLNVVQHDSASLMKLLGPDFRLKKTQSERHLTPSGSEQLFQFNLFQRARSTSSE
jgi:SAM-dependent methyltransferase